jgi:hypothetical protein
MDNMNESIVYSTQLDSNIVELIVDTFVDNEEVVVSVDNNSNISEDIIDNNFNQINDKINKNKRKKCKQNINKISDEMDLFPKRIKIDENDKYVFDLQLSALQLEVDFSKLTFLSLAKHLRTEQLAFIFAIKLGLNLLFIYNIDITISLL